MGVAAHLAVDDGGEGEVVEDLGAVPPHSDRAVLAEALVVESVHLGDLPRFVVAPDQGDPVWVPDLRVIQGYKVGLNVFYIHDGPIIKGITQYRLASRRRHAV